MHRSRAHRKLPQLLPALAEMEFEFVWEGRIAMTTDRLPKIVRFGERALSLYGYSGRGIGPGMVFGRAAAEFLLSGDVSKLPLEPTTRHREYFCGIKRVCYELGAPLFHLAAGRVGSSAASGS